MINLQSRASQLLLTIVIIQEVEDRRLNNRYVKFFTSCIMSIVKSS